MTRSPFVVGEWYHCFNRGVDKRKVFENASDYERFLSLMYLCNGKKPVQLFNLKEPTLQKILTEQNLERGVPLVEIGVYALMPNHVHFLLKEISDGGIGLFMQKMFTGYTMYFNKKNHRTGALFSGTFKSKYINKDTYLKLVVPYILLNPVELFDSSWKKGKGNTTRIKTKMKTYPYSSFPDFFGKKRLENKIVGNSLSEYYDSVPSLEEMIRDASDYYREKSRNPIEV